MSQSASRSSLMRHCTTSYRTFFKAIYLLQLMIGNNRIVMNFSFFFNVSLKILAMNCIVKTWPHCKFACCKSHNRDGEYSWEYLCISCNFITRFHPFLLCRSPPPLLSTPATSPMVDNNIMWVCSALSTSLLKVTFHPSPSRPNPQCIWVSARVTVRVTVSHENGRSFHLPKRCIVC